jgi:hypothetical protein
VRLDFTITPLLTRSKGSALIHAYAHVSTGSGMGSLAVAVLIILFSTTTRSQPRLLRITELQKGFAVASPEQRREYTKGSIATRQ